MASRLPMAALAGIIIALVIAVGYIMIAKDLLDKAKPMVQTTTCQCVEDAVIATIVPKGTVKTNEDLLEKRTIHLCNCMEDDIKAKDVSFDLKFYVDGKEEKSVSCDMPDKGDLVAHGGEQYIIFREIDSCDWKFTLGEANPGVTVKIQLYYDGDKQGGSSVSIGVMD